MSTQLSRERVREIATELLAGWDNHPNTSDVRYGEVMARQACVVALAAHTHQLARAAFMLMDAGRTLEAGPTVRACWESGITSHWLAQIPTGIEVFVLQGMRQRRRIGDTIRRTPWPGAAEAADRVAATDDTSPYLSVAGEPTSFESICNDLHPAGAESYAVYRMLSRYAHAGPFVADEYLDPRSEDLSQDPTVVQLLTPKPQDSSSPAWYVTASMVWAGRAVDFADRRRSRRSALRTAARELGTVGTHEAISRVLAASPQ